MLDNILRQIIHEQMQRNAPIPVVVNMLREYIQYLVLSRLYTHRSYKQLIFKGGSCLRVCFDLPRLSEDLDFDTGALKAFSLATLGDNIQRMLKSTQHVTVEVKRQGEKRLYLKFPILKRLKLAKPHESDKLYVKLEMDDGILPYAKTDLTAISRFGFNFLVRHYDLPTLMVGKIHAILYRMWFKGEKNEVDVKGRDFYDLFWFLERGVTPNWRCLKKITDIGSEKELKALLSSRVRTAVTPEKLRYDLSSFLSDQAFVNDFSHNYSTLIRKFLA